MSSNNKKPANQSSDKKNTAATPSSSPNQKQDKPVNNKPEASKSTSTDKNNIAANPAKSPSKDTAQEQLTTAKPLNGNANKQAAKPASTPNKPTTQANKSATSQATKASDNGNNGQKSSGSNPPQKPGPAKQSPLPLIISIVALGVGGYALYNSMTPAQQQNDDIPALKTQISELQQALDAKAATSEVTTLQTNIDDLSKQVKSSDSPAGVDEATVQKLVAEKIEQAKQSLADQQANTESLSKDEVSTMIKEALAGSEDGKPVVDFSSEINAIKQDKAEIQQYLEQIQAQGEKIRTSLTKTAEQAKSSLSQAASQAEEKVASADNQPNVYPLINTLRLADIANKAHQYGIANQYLAQAKDSFAKLHLDQAPYSDFAAQINSMADQTAKLAEQQNDQKQIDQIINEIGNWPFISTNPENLLDQKSANKPTQSWKDDLKDIGSNIVSSTITITKNDAAGLTWINENPHLQQIIHENVRLDLAMIRNAMLLGDQERATAVASTLREEIARYFDTDAASVKQALSTLEQLTSEKSDVPDIASLIQSIQQAG